jgi:cell division protein FtsN
MRMGKPARNRTEKKANTRRGGSTFIGFLFGLITGLFIALAVAWYINRLPNPFREKPRAAAKDAPPAYPGKPLPKLAAPDADKGNALIRDARSDKSDKSTAEKSTAAPREAFFLQVGSFQNAGEADGMKGQLALLGLEATVQTRTVPEKGVWHRVRMGPYTSMDELNRVRSVLQQNHIDSALVKVREGE